MHSDASIESAKSSAVLKLGYPVQGLQSMVEGVQLPKCSKIIHWGPSSDLEEYAQETGRARRDGLHSEAVLFIPSKKLFQYIQDSMKLFCLHEQHCRRQTIIEHFVVDTPTGLSNLLNTCLCSDVCEKKCKRQKMFNILPPNRAQ